MNPLATQIFEIMFPIVMIVIIGVMAGRYATLDLSHANNANLNYFIPALVFSSFSNTQFAFSGYATLAVCGLLIVAIAALASVLIARLGHFSYRTIAPPLMFHNAGNVGLPLFALSFGSSGLAAGLILFLIGNITHFAIGSYLLDKKPHWFRSLMQPGIIAAIIALGLQGMSVQIPDFAILPFSMLGAIAVPLMLFSLGVRIASAHFQHIRFGLLIGFLTPCIGILSAWLLVTLFDLTGIQAACLLLFGALPPAVMNYVFAERYQQEPDKVSSIVLLGNIIAIVVLPAALSYVLPNYS